MVHFFFSLALLSRGAVITPARVLLPLHDGLAWHEMDACEIFINIMKYSECCKHIFEGIFKIIRFSTFFPASSSYHVTRHKFPALESLKLVSTAIHTASGQTLPSLP